jgi:L,D-transpeptidase ErfK/SrfK
LGKYALYLALKGSYLIHGTNKPYGVGMRVSHGCIRLYPESIESLYPQVPVGTPVRIIKERVLLGVRGGVVYVQAFRSIDKRGEEQQNLTPHIETVLRQVPRGTTVDWNKVVGLLSTARGFPVPITPGSPDADQIASDAAEVAAETPDARR